LIVDDSHQYTVGVLTVSDRGTTGDRINTSGPALAKILIEQGFQVRQTGMVADEIPAIQAMITGWVDNHQVDLVITTGGTGLSPRDVTPEATSPLLDRLIPGISEAMRQAGLQKTATAMLSRGMAGTRKGSLIVNLPGSEKAARENLLAVIAALPHALYKLQGGQGDCG